MNPWTCPVCKRGVAPGVTTCDHGGDTPGIGAVPVSPPPVVPGVQMLGQCTLCGAWFNGYHVCWTYAPNTLPQVVTVTGTEPTTSLTLALNAPYMAA